MHLSDGSCVRNTLSCMLLVKYSLVKAICSTDRSLWVSVSVDTCVCQSVCLYAKMSLQVSLCNVWVRRHTLVCQKQLQQWWRLLICSMHSSGTMCMALSKVFHAKCTMMYEDIAVTITCSNILSQTLSVWMSMWVFFCLFNTPHAAFIFIAGCPLLPAFTTGQAYLLVYNSCGCSDCPSVRLMICPSVWHSCR